jgi:hypothetical protein
VYSSFGCSIGGEISCSGSFDTIKVGNGCDTVSDHGGFCTIVAGDGHDDLSFTGYFNTVVAGNGGDTVRGGDGFSVVSLGNGNNHVQLGGDGNMVRTGSGDDSIMVSGWGNYIDAGGAAQMNFISGGCGFDTFVLNAAGAGLDQIANFSLTNGDMLDLTRTMAATDWNGHANQLSRYLSTEIIGHDTWLMVDPSGQPSGTHMAVAELTSIRTSLSALLAHDSIRIG